MFLIKPTFILTDLLVICYILDVIIGLWYSISPPTKSWQKWLKIIIGLGIINLPFASLFHEDDNLLVVLIIAALINLGFIIHYFMRTRKQLAISRKTIIAQLAINLIVLALVVRFLRTMKSLVRYRYVTKRRRGIWQSSPSGTIQPLVYQPDSYVYLTQTDPPREFIVEHGSTITNWFGMHPYVWYGQPIRSVRRTG